MILTGEGGDRTAHVVLSGRLATTRRMESEEVAGEVRDFVAGNYERYKSKAVERGELEEMSIVARWLRERASDEGRLIYLNGPHLDLLALHTAQTRQSL